MGISMMIAGQIYFWLPGDIVITDWFIVVSKSSWHCVVLLGQHAWSTHFAFVLPYELDVVWLFFALILVELRN